ncbi:pilus assembly protein [Ornithinimicrobium faecis]|uniref:Pilus assembly protein n=1 Tax=Ornithinimicrobium faecis TaxID=2934158 RepID=A0ABY4YQF6_9MICO|nr:MULTISPECIES: pilus assembly protein [unclassified Ornithinimicrobium]USQ78844.1 pilus assembly protein [Ornithinimicrobium sp. HY1793]
MLGRLRTLLRHIGGTAPDRGSMLVETAFLLVLVMLPLLYLVGTLGRLQAGAYAVSAAAREAGRTFVTSDDDAEGHAAAHTSAMLVMQAHGFTTDEGGVAIACEQSPCLTPGSTVRSDATIDVALPLIPDFLSGALPTTVTLSSSHVSPVDEFREQ